jgi:hypothetical protein
MTIQVAEAHDQNLVSVVKMVPVLEKNTTEEQIFLARFLCRQKDSVQRIFMKKYSSLHWCLSHKAVRN